jgi:5-formyltetrahydrofolate cyclo-ligase
MLESEKQSLRAGIRKELAPPGTEAASAIRTRLMTLGCWNSARTIFSYHPLWNEVNLLPLLDEGGAKEWIFPRVDGETLSLHRWSPQAPWRKGPFDIREPDPSSWEEAGIGTIDLALVPGLAFDRNGGRLGRGMGFYDRLLSSAGFRALKIGIVTERFLLQAIPTEPHDIGMDLVVTEAAVHVTKGCMLDNGIERE